MLKEDGKPREFGMPIYEDVFEYAQKHQDRVFPSEGREA